MLAGREFFSMVILEGGRRGGGGILSHYKCLYSKERDYKSTLYVGAVGIVGIVGVVGGK